MENKNKKIGLIVTCVLLVVLMAGGTVLYNTLAGEVKQPAARPEADAPAAQENAAVTLAPTAEAAAAVQTTLEVAGPVPVKNLAKDFTVYTDDGAQKRLIDLRGKPAVINFFASWCGPCKMEMPHFDEAYKAYGDTIEFMMVDLCAYGNDTKENAKKLVADGGWTFPVYFDTEGSATTAYSVRSMPTTIFVSADGELVGKRVGALSAAQLQAQIDALLAKE